MERHSGFPFNQKNECTFEGNAMIDADTTGISRSLETPESTLRKFTQYVRACDLDNLVALYEPDAVFSPEPVVTVKGHQGLRAAFGELFAIKPIFELVSTQVQESGDLALAANDWTLSGTAPDGTPVNKSGRSSVVLRRNPQGQWLIAIDRP
ncbi:MAG: DUF4440 domain-containing protein [Myxococcales bacterium]|nr:DUF4440 domain-containing protein [Myxococcales bacterium]